MYVQVAHYRLGTGSAEELARRVADGPLKAMPEVPGFFDYYAFDAGDGLVASVSVFESRTGVEEAEERLGEWVERTIGEFDIEPGHMSEGPVFATTRNGG
jgi:heme-degrading monooxygenase HmoA